MEKVIIRLVVLSFILLVGCEQKRNEERFKRYITESKSSLNRSYEITDLFEHFPDSFDFRNIGFLFYPPVSPPENECIKQFGDFIMMQSYSVEKEEIEALIKSKYIYKTNYFDKNIIIDLIELRKEIYPIKKCNKWVKDKYPIPYFEKYDFGLGGDKTKVFVKGESPIYVHTHIVPEDLQVYVIKSEAGDFWIESCDEKRPEPLKEWKHGYSTGIAISNQENIIVYWVIVW
jgi:hypothetical protein